MCVHACKQHQRPCECGICTTAVGQNHTTITLVNLSHTVVAHASVISHAMRSQLLVWPNRSHHAHSTSERQEGQHTGLRTHTKHVRQSVLPSGKDALNAPNNCMLSMQATQNRCMRLLVTMKVPSRRRKETTGQVHMGVWHARQDCQHPLAQLSFMLSLPSLTEHTKACESRRRSASTNRHVLDSGV